jgi:hypothetical protein
MLQVVFWCRVDAFTCQSRLVRARSALRSGQTAAKDVRAVEESRRRLKLVTDAKFQSYRLAEMHQRAGKRKQCED